MSVLEQNFMKALLLALGSRPDLRVHRQNVGSVPLYKGGKAVGIFEAGPPPGAADISGISFPEGRRLEVEVKGSKTRSREAQENWERMILRMGGIYVRVRYDEDFSMEENVKEAVQQVLDAIESRRMCNP